MRKFKKILTSFFMMIAAMGTQTQTANAQFVTIDPASIAQDALNFVETVAKYKAEADQWIKQIDYYKNQIDEMKRQYDAMTGFDFKSVLDLGTSGNAARTNLYRQFRRAGDTVGIALPTAEVEKSANQKSIEAKYKFLPSKDMFPGDVDLQKRREEQTQAVYAAEMTVTDTLDTAQVRYDTYDEIAKKIAEAKDIKAAQDISNLLALENGRNIAKSLELQTVQLNVLKSILAKDVSRGDSSLEFFGTYR